LTTLFVTFFLEIVFLGIYFYDRKKRLKLI